MQNQLQHGSFAAVVFVALGYKAFVFDGIQAGAHSDVCTVNFQNKLFFSPSWLGLCLFTQAAAGSSWILRSSAYCRRKTTLLYLTLLLLLLSYAPEPNTGPSTKNSSANTTHSPCGTCGVVVTWDSGVRGIACDNGGLWFHAHCQNIDCSTFGDPVNESANIPGYCAICRNPYSL